MESYEINDLLLFYYYFRLLVYARFYPRSFYPQDFDFKLLYKYMKRNLSFKILSPESPGISWDKEYNSYEILGRSSWGNERC